MYANRVHETTSTTGTGNFTLTGAVDADHETFNTAFGLNYRFKYFAQDTTGNTWERGIGYLSASTTMVRETIRENSAGTTAAINFANAPEVFVGLQAQDYFQLPKYVGSVVTQRNNLTTATIGTLNLITSREYYVNVLLPEINISNIGIEVTSGAAVNANMAVYDSLSSNGQPGTKIAETGNFSVATTGIKLNAITLPKGLNGWVWVALISNGTPQIRKFASGWSMDIGSDGYPDAARYAAGTGTTLPSPASTGLTVATSAFFTVHFS